MRRNRMTVVAISCGLLCFLTGLGGVVRSQSSVPPPDRVVQAVRVWNGNEFVANLGLQDFELTENGVPQTIDALFLVDKNSVVRKDGQADFVPGTSRNFYLLFQLHEYNPQISQAIRYFFEEGILAGDSLTIQTPMKNYTLTPAALAGKPRDVLARELDDIVRKDVLAGNMAYRSLMSELKIFVRRISGQNSMSSFGDGSAMSLEDFSLEDTLKQYRGTTSRMEELRRTDADKIMSFARSLKDVPDQKIVFFIYQREFSPEVSPMVLNELAMSNQDNQANISDLHELFQVYHRPLAIDPEEISRTFADSSTNFNLLFMDRKPDRIGGLVMRERSEDVFKVFTAVARTTGGISETSSNPKDAVENALKTCAMYYLVYYTPVPRTPGDSFKTVVVRVKGKDYKVTGRSGYLEN